MARNTNPGNALAGFSGKLNGVVIKQYKGMTVMAALPRKSKKKPTAKKRAVNELWQVATLYAKTVVKNPDWKLAVAIALKIEQGKVYTTLISDFMKNNGDVDKILQIPAAPAL
ncbi:hypothetical protein [Flavihumibacter fluvii]|uniref:hypothetical protein n=1 Tax=Flavihumibacter fluvii TaxID=2838157 RepID=UPI001BDF6699|nr:hypothetical protein [Flavihumibacter fluvii]ULQ51312.1 hypothetical protein KJS93_14570 [Flavihumibacter fluvii]